MAAAVRNTAQNIGRPEADIMVPMAIPSFGGMLVMLLSVFLVPVLYCQLEEWRLMVSGATEPAFADRRH